MNLRLHDGQVQMNSIRRPPTNLLKPSSRPKLLSASCRRHSTIQILHDGSVDSFRRQCWEPEVPSVLPRGSFKTLPAVTKWFTQPGIDTPNVALSSEYWSPYGDTIVPLELTRSNAESTSDHEDSTFKSFQAPLSLFIDWTKSAKQEPSERLYLAQASLSDLPQSLRDDVPAPEIVTRAGRGDIYDANVWIGRAPTYTPLHRDPNPNLFVQLAGSKSVRIFRPEEGAAIFRAVQTRLGRHGSAVFRGDEMMHGPERTLLEEAVWRDERSEACNAELEQGDGLFIPKGWWHSIKGVGDGITGSVNWWFR